MLVAEAYLVVSREYLPGDPGYLVDATAGTGGPPVELVLLGDSTVAGVGSPTVDESLAVLLAERVAALLGRQVHVVGYGESGARTADVLADQVPRLVDARADVVVLVVGSNDVTHAASPGALRERTVALLREAQERSGAPVVLGGIPRFRAVPALAEPLRSIVDSWASPLRRAQQAAVAQVDGARFVNLGAEASPRFIGVPESMSSDGFHPSPVGYGYWADALAPAIANALT